MHVRVLDWDKRYIYIYNIVFRTKHKGCELRKANDKRTQPFVKFDPTNKYSI